MNTEGLSNYSDTALQKELENRAKKSQLLKTIPQPKENIDWDKFLKGLQGSLDTIAEEGYIDDDSEHYTFEALIEAVYGHSFWDWYNQFSR